jgi:hypothetical protein
MMAGEIPGGECRREGQVSHLRGNRLPARPTIMKVRSADLTPGSNARRRVVGRLLGAFGVAVGIAPLALGQAPSRVVVLMPDIDEPFRGIFLRIIEGIKSRIAGPADIVFVNTQTPVEIAAELLRRQARLVVAMGRQGLQSISALQGSVPIIAGCVVSVQESEIRGYPVYTLAPDPGVLFTHLRELAPSIRRVSVVADPRQNAWLIRRAREAARPLNIEVVAHETDDPAAALRLYAQILRSVEPGRDALWCPRIPPRSSRTPFCHSSSRNPGIGGLWCSPAKWPTSSGASCSRSILTKCNWAERLATLR